MSVAINPTRHIAIIGVPIDGYVSVLDINTTSSDCIEWTLNIRQIYATIKRVTGVGRSIVWLDDSTVAIAVLTVPNRPWSASEVWVHHIDTLFKSPLFVFPNNQQKIFFPLTRFLQIFTWSGNILILTDRQIVLFVPARPPGFFSEWNPLPFSNNIVYNSKPCLAGTYKNTSNFGPCIICPTQTKNPGKQPCSKCEPCASTSFCPLGSVGDVSLSDYPSYTQTYSYPDSPDMNNYDDLLVHNIFNIGKTRRCIVISPLFWTIIIITLCFIIWFVMILLKICKCQKGYSHRNRLKLFFKKIDIISEGKQWIGGLFSFSIIALFGFVFWFASGFLNLYPIELSSMSYISCDDTIRNAVYESALQLPLPNPDGNEWKIFKMLNDQPFTMTIDLINTAANCSDIRMQLNKLGGRYILLTIKSCVRQPDNITLSISFSLLNHRTTIQMNITGPYFVGGMRLCLNGPGHVNDVNTLQTLDMCELFFTSNETLSLITTLHMVLIKIINVTKPLNVGDNTHYHGRWAPTFAESLLSDELLYNDNVYGQSLRYHDNNIMLVITLSEQPFYLQNIQQPIVRRAELFFHTLLFCTLIIELFGMGFLIFKLAIIPFIHAIVRCCCCRCHHKKRNYNVRKTSSTRTIQEILDINDMNMHENKSRY